ncbi:MAG TPA: polysaccharide deacetylase family protein [Solirubrobacteraceae bacterium]|nr:polysaccharide deacetylase family protein [Solirubrobacteraceae bacterium]
MPGLGLALTFDDGPDQHWTPLLLDRLASHGAHATFFVIAPRAASQSGLVARMLEHGHKVGLHCDRHVRHFERDRAWLEADTTRALGRLREMGVVPSLWRTPWGTTAPWTDAIAQRHGLRLVRWSVDTHDWRGDSAPEMFAATREQLTPGAVVLAHDGLGPGARRDGIGETIAYLDLVAGHAGEHRLPLEALA